MRLDSGFPTFKPVLGFEDTHVVSNYGDVVRKERVLVDALGRIRTFPARTLKPTRKTDGYSHVTITAADGSMHTIHIHRMILEAFVGPRPEGMEVLHADSDKLNNQLANLRWDTHIENCKDRSRRATSGSVLTYEKAQEIRSLRGVLKQVDLAKRFGVSQPLVSKILRGELWTVAPQESAA